MDEKPSQSEPMPWFDRKKGKLDYVLAAVPLASLVFVVVAYFHTVHPLFARQQELTDALDKVAQLEGTLIEQQGVSEQLQVKLQDVSDRLRGAQLQSRYLVGRLRDALPDGTFDEIQRSAMLRYYSAEDAVKAYVDFENQDAGLDRIEVKDVSRVTLQPQGTDRRFLFLTHPGFCGSGGCTGPLFEEEFESYCFVAWAHSRTLPMLAPRAGRWCSEVSKSIPWLDDRVAPDKGTSSTTGRNAKSA